MTRPAPRQALRDARLRQLRGLYAIVDGSAPGQPLELVEAFLRADAPVIQLRQKGLPTGELLALARAACARCREAGALLLINDRPDVAVLAGADGVHLGQEDLPVAAARAILGPDALIGLSTHSDQELDAALGSGADYLGFGPIFTTGTKALTAPGGAALPPPHGLAGLARAVQRTGAIPLVAIGGLTPATAGAVAATGAACAAAIAWLSHQGAPSSEERARAFANAFAAGAAGFKAAGASVAGGSAK